MNKNSYQWTDNPTVSGVAVCDTDILNDCLMHLKYNHNSSNFSLFDIVQKDHILTFEESKGLAMLGTFVYKEAIAGSRYGYPDFYEKCLQEKELSTATETTFGETTITIYTNTNGHKFYNISDQPIIDSIFAERKEAMFYGIDEENKRIFLPRRTRSQITLNPNEVNEFVEAGLPNITGKFGCNVNSDEGNISTTGAFTKRTFGSDGSTGDEYNSTEWTMDASRCSSIYGNSDTVQPSGSLILEYMVVGNITSNDGLTEVVNNGMEILEQVNLGLESKADKTTVDGQWVGKNAVLTQEISAGTTTIDMSDYLPNDGHNYEVFCVLAASLSDSAQYSVYSDIIGQSTIRLQVAKDGYHNGSYFTMPVGVQRKMYFYKTVALASAGNRGIEALAYRRIGTNV